jgi:transcriptional regulator with XRE-family HTH domain
MKNRIAEIMEKQKLTSLKFANLIGIQPSAVSHILSGRNNPSMDVIQKILNTFRTINPDWLILGVGAMYRETGETAKKQPVEVKITSNRPQMASLFPAETDNGAKKTIENEISAIVAPDFLPKKTFDSPQLERPSSESPKMENKQADPAVQLSFPKKVIKKIIVYYSDNTFEEYNMRLNTEE